MNSLKTKQELINQIKECQIKQEIEKDIKTVLDQFKHYKAVNKRFTDKLIELGYNAYLTKVNGFHRFSVYKVVDNRQVSVELYVYNKDLTWDDIENHLNNEKDREEFLTNRLARYDEDFKQLKGLVEYMDKIPEGSNFESDVYSFLSSLKWEIEKIERAS